MLLEAIQLALKAHGSQTRKNCSEPYIFHVLRVAQMVRDAGGSEEAQVAAVLHDVVEDTEYTVKDIIKELPLEWPPPGPGWYDSQWPPICRMIHALTRQDGQDKVQAVERLEESWVPHEAILIKIADRIDNLRPDGEGAFGPVWMKKQLPSTYRLLEIAEQNFGNNKLYRQLQKRVKEIEELVIPEPKPVIEGATRPVVEGDD